MVTQLQTFLKRVICVYVLFVFGLFHFNDFVINITFESNNGLYIVAHKRNQKTKAISMFCL